MKPTQLANKVSATGVYSPPHVKVFLAEDGKKMATDRFENSHEVCVVTFYKPQSLSIRDSYYLFEFFVAPSSIIHSALIAKEYVDAEIIEAIVGM